MTPLLSETPRRPFTRFSCRLVVGEGQALFAMVTLVWHDATLVHFGKVRAAALLFL